MVNCTVTENQGRRRGTPAEFGTSVLPGTPGIFFAAPQTSPIHCTIATNTGFGTRVPKIAAVECQYAASVENCIIANNVFEEGGVSVSADPGGYVGQDHSLWNIEPTLFNVPGDSGRVTTTRQFPLTLPEHFVRVQRN